MPSRFFPIVFILLLVIFLGGLLLGTRVPLAQRIANTIISTIPSPILSPPSSVQNTNQQLPNVTNWLTYANPSFGFSIQYPASWIVNTQCEKYGAIFFGYSQETSGKCNVYFNPRDLKNFKIDIAFAMISIEKEEESFEEAKTDLVNDPKLKGNIDSQILVTVAGQDAIKLSGVVKDSDNPLFPNGTVLIIYIIKTPNGSVLTLGYNQQPGWQDQTQIFEAMVKTVRFQ